jgi:hypothetical protein
VESVDEAKQYGKRDGKGGNDGKDGKDRKDGKEGRRREI